MSFPGPHFALRDDEPDAATHVVTVEGEVHVTTSAELARHLEAAIATGKSNLVVDLGDVDFIDSTGLSVLLNALRRITRERGSMLLACANPTVLRLFEITRLDSTFTIVPTREAALARASAQAAGSSAEGAP